MPLVSFLIATYNRSDFVVDCINSILVQNRKDFELIVVDDASTDSTESVIKAKFVGKVNYYKNNVNRGVAFTRNVAFKHSSGEFIALLDSDDILFNPDFLDIALNVMESEKADVFCCDNYRIDKDGRVLSPRTFFQDTIDHRYIKLSTGIKDFDYVFFHGIHSCGMLIRKSAIDKTGFLDVKYKIAWDEDLFLRMASFPECKIYYYNEPLAGYRIHGGNISGNLSVLYREKILCRKNILNNNRQIKDRLGSRVNKRFASQYFCLADAYKIEKKFLLSFLTVIKLIFIYPYFILSFLNRRLVPDLYGEGKTNA